MLSDTEAIVESLDQGHPYGQGEQGVASQDMRELPSTDC